MTNSKEKPVKFDQIEMDLEQCAANFTLIGKHLKSIATYLRTYDPKSDRAKIDSIVKTLEGSCRTINKLKLDSTLDQNPISRCSILLLQFQHHLELISRYFATPDKKSSELSKITKALDNINRSFEGLKLTRSK